MQNGVSLEHYTDAGKLAAKPAWTYDVHSRGTPVVFEGKVILWGYKGETSDLVELITCLDAKTGKLSRFATLTVGKTPWWVMAVEMPGK